MSGRVEPPDDVPFPRYTGGNGDQGDELAALVAEVGELRAEVEHLKADRAQDQETIKQLTELAPAADELAALVQDGDSGGPALDAKGDDEKTLPFCWGDASLEERADQVLALARWIKDLLKPRYPQRTAIIRACWPLHPTAVEELSWLRGEWYAATREEGARYRDLGDWHDRWLPGVLHRFQVDGEFQECIKDEHAHARLLKDAQNNPDAIAIMAARELRQTAAKAQASASG